MRNDPGGFTAVGRRKIIETHRGEIQNQALARRIRQHKLRGQDYPGSLARQPRVHAGIGGDNFLETQIVATRNIGQRVLVMCGRYLNPAHDIRALWRKQKAVAGGRGL